MAKAMRRSIHHASRILLAEDDAEMRSLVAGALRLDGHEVVEVADGGGLLRQIANAMTSDGPAIYDLVLSDIRMPVCNGMQVLECLRQTRWGTPVILMTAFGDHRTRVEVESMGAFLVDKPFDLDDLRTLVLNLVPAAS